MISQKATILCVYEILKKYSDENHIISAEKIREKLKVIYDVDMERRAIYRNIDALRSMGIDIEGYTDNREGYYLIDRTFETSEIRLLCDAVASSDMIKEENSNREKELVWIVLDGFHNWYEKTKIIREEIVSLRTLFDIEYDSIQNTIKCYGREKEPCCIITL